MRNLITVFKRSPKKTFAVLTLAFVGLFSANLLAWGPASRPTFTREKPSTYITFNSITNNPAYGDERNFVAVREKGASAATNSDKIAVEPGKEYTFRVYFHNNAASNYNLVAKNTTLEMRIPSSVKAGEEARVTGIISADNANPKQVWDEAYLTAKQDLKITYVPGSAVIYSFGEVNGQKLPDSVINAGGTLLGYDKLDGNVPGCNEYSGYVLLNVKVEDTTPKTPDFSVSKQVRKSGTTDWKETVAVKPGEEVEYLIHYKNTGNTTQTDVVIKDVLPSNVELVKGSVRLANANTQGQAGTVSDKIIEQNGMNIGTYTAGSNAYISFKAKVKVSDECGKEYKLVNWAHAVTKDGSKKDDATVTVKTDDCKPVVKKVDVCDPATKKIISVDEKDASKYEPKDSELCKEKPPVVEKVEVCNPETGKIITVDKKDEGKYEPKDSELCKEKPPVVEKVEVCNPDTKKIITVNKEDADKYLPKDSDKCKPAPAPVEELPKTGVNSVLNGVFSLGALTSSFGYYVSSRRRL